MCASPLSPRHAQPDWMGGGLVSRQMMHAPPSVIFLSAWLWIGQADDGCDFDFLAKAGAVPEPEIH